MLVFFMVILNDVMWLLFEFLWCGWFDEIFFVDLLEVDD